MDASPGCHDLTAMAMQMHCNQSGLPRTEPHGQKGPDHPGQDIPRTSLGKRGRSGEVDGCAPIRGRNYRVSSLEHDRNPSAYRGIPRHRQSIRLNFGNGDTQHAGHFTRVGRDDQGRRSPLQKLRTAGKRGEGIGIDYRWQTAIRDDKPDKFKGLRAGPYPRADGDSGLAGQHRQQVSGGITVPIERLYHEIR